VLVLEEEHRSSERIACQEPVRVHGRRGVDDPGARMVREDALAVWAVIRSSPLEISADGTRTTAAGEVPWSASGASPSRSYLHHRGPDEIENWISTTADPARAMPISASMCWLGQSAN